jgi:hypothetical protein
LIELIVFSLQRFVFLYNADGMASATSGKWPWTICLCFRSCPPMSASQATVAGDVAACHAELEQLLVQLQSDTPSDDGAARDAALELARRLHAARTALTARCDTAIVAATAAHRS